MSAIYKREILSYFTTPIGYVFFSIFFALSGYMFVENTVILGTTDTMPYFSSMLLIFVIIIPLLTMKMLSEERKNGTERLLLTSPVGLMGIIGAKFFAAFTLFASTLGISCLLNVFVLEDIAISQENAIAKINMPTLFSCILGVLLIGAAFISIGIFVSSLTENQIVAAVASIGAFALLIACSTISVYVENSFVKELLRWFSVVDRLSSFGSGIFDFTAIVYYISICIIFLFLTVRVYEKRRWS